jgi:hypothetical protein
MTTSTRKKRKPAGSTVTAGTLGAEGLEQLAPLGDALIIVLAIVEDFCARHPRRALAARANWARVVDRALFEDHDEPGSSHPPRAAADRAAPVSATLARAIAEVESMVRARLDDRGWPVVIGADERAVTELAWERIKRRCARGDAARRKRLAKARPH